MEEYPSNSRSRRPEPEPSATKKVERVVQGEVVRRKKPLGRRIAETFVGGDARSVWSYVMLDVLIPAAKDGVVDAFQQGIERMFFPDSNPRGGRRHRGGGGSYVSYNRYSQSGSRRDRDRDEPRQMSRRGRSAHNFDEIILPTRVEAEEVIDRLFDLVAKFDVATVADLYDLVGVPNNYTDNKWGWEGDECLRGAGVTHIRGGYLLDLPRPEPLD